LAQLLALIPPSLSPAPFYLSGNLQSNKEMQKMRYIGNIKHHRYIHPVQALAFWVFFCKVKKKQKIKKIK